MTYEEAVAALYRAPLAEFVTERTRLAGELKRAGDKGSAALLGKHARPSVSAWVVNQLWARDQEAIEALFASGARLRRGEVGIAGAHRQATNDLVARAATILTEAGHSASEATLRKVNANLSALTAKGGFEPDPPGALRNDRDPPGFEAMAADPAPESPSKPRDPADEERLRREAEAAEAARLAAEAKARLQRERDRLTAALADAQATAEKLEQEHTRQESALAATKQKLVQATALVSELTAQLSSLGGA